MNVDIIIGWFLGVISSIVSGVVVFWLQTRRDAQLERLRQKREDVRIARNWAQEGKKASLRGFDLAGQNLSGKNFSSADLEEADFEAARMYGTNFHQANMIRAILRKTKIVEVSFEEAKLLGADFSGVIFRHVDFTGAKLQKANFQNVKIEVPCIWTSVEIDASTKLSDELRAEIERGALPKPVSPVNPTE